jgi:hypothetical protein
MITVLKKEGRKMRANHSLKKLSALGPHLRSYGHFFDRYVFLRG